MTEINSLNNIEIKKVEQLKEKTIETIISVQNGVLSLLISESLESTMIGKRDIIKESRKISDINVTSIISSEIALKGELSRIEHLTDEILIKAYSKAMGGENIYTIKNLVNLFITYLLENKGYKQVN
nr:hypothetical protein [Candidatus Gracilibacteria bacterium]